jgi:hypothetical protein
LTSCFFSLISFTWAPEYPIRAILNLCENGDGDIHNFVFIGGVVADKLFTDVSNISYKLSPVSLLRAIKINDSMIP